VSAAVVVPAIGVLLVVTLLWIWIRTWRAWRRQRRADEQLRLELLQRRGWRELQRRNLLDREIHR
jgi:type VI protein secretion system component VasK